MTEPASRRRPRTARACMHCRRRKTKCDGGQPCSPCQTSETVCSYDSKDQRMSTAQYIKSLEKRVCDLEELLDGQATRSAGVDGLRRAPRSARASEGGAEYTVRSSSLPSTRSEAQVSDEDVIETMIGVREDDLENARSSERYRGSFAGLGLLQRVQNLCRHLSGVPRSLTTERVEDDFVRAFDFTPASFRSTTSREPFPLLPLSEYVDHAIDVVVNQACSNMQFLDSCSLRSMARQIYAEAETGSYDYHGKSLALLYGILALARLFEVVPSNAAMSTEQGVPSGFRFFNACRTIIDPTDCHDLVSLQALLCMILYTQASSMMSTCYSYICMAVAASLQMGLFTNVFPPNMSSYEKLCRRRIFAVLNIMDTYVTIALGLPKTFRDIVSDQALPTPAKPVSVTDPLAGTYAHAQLIQILATAVDTNHPVTRPIYQKNGFYGVEYCKITAIEAQLEAWFAQLPPFPETADTADDRTVVRSQLLLRFSYAHVQMVLYKPFLHHALKDVRRNGTLSLKAYACGSACIKAAMQVVWLAERLEACNLFNEAQWFTTLIIAFTASCLALFVISNTKDPTLGETSDAVRRIRKLCSRHADRNASMHRCFKFLRSLPPNEESICVDGTLDSYSGFPQDLSSLFSKTYKELDTAKGEDFPGRGMLQALSLPSYVHSSDQSYDI